MKKIMILGASILQLPAIRKAKEMGLTVIAVDIDEDAVGFKEADICLLISTIDTEKVLEAAKKYEIDGIMTLASDMPMRTIAEVSQKLHLPGIDEKTALKATDKVEMRKALKASNVPIPQFYYCNKLDDYKIIVNNFKQKYIVKPSDNSGSRGIYLVESQEESEKAFYYSRKNSRSGIVLVEEYMEGPEVSAEALTIDGETSVIAITDKITTGPPNFVEIGHTQPSHLSKDIQKKIEEISIWAIQAIGIKNGPSHIEIKITKEGPKVVELGARLGGDNIATHLVPLSTGVDMVKATIEIALNKKTTIKQRWQRYAAIRYFHSKPGKLKKILGLNETKQLKEVYEVIVTKEKGEMITSIHNSADRLGYFILCTENIDSINQISKKIVEDLKIVIDTEQ